MEKKRLAQLFFVIIAVVLIVFLANEFLLPKANQVNQTISYSDFELTKKISLSSNQRSEEYSFDLVNPVVVYIVIPKSIAQDVSELKLSGDFTSEVIKTDPIIKLIPKENSPGLKKLTIKSPINDRNKTSLAFVLPLIEYNKATDEERKSFEDTLVLVAERGEENFVIDESKKIMQNYANELGSANVEAQNQKPRVELSAKKESAEKTVKLFLAKSTDSKDSGSAFVARATQALMNTVPIRTETLTNQEYPLIITFGEENNLGEIPNEINLFVSGTIPSDEVISIFKTENFSSEQKTEIIVEGQLSEYINSGITESESVSVLSTQINMPEEKAKSYPAGTTMSGKLTIKRYLYTRTINLNITFGECEQTAGDVERQTELDFDTKSFIITDCYAKKIREINNELSQDLEKLTELRNNILEYGNSATGNVPYYTNEMEDSFNYGNPYNMSFNSIASNYTIKESDFAKMKSMELLNAPQLLYNDNCNSASQVLQDTSLIPQSPYDPSKSKSGYNPEFSYNSLLKTNLPIDKNYYDYFETFCRYRKNLEKIDFYHAGGTGTLKKSLELQKDETGLIQAQAEFFEESAQSAVLKEELWRLVLSNKLLQAENLHSLTTYRKEMWTITQTVPEGGEISLPNLPEKGWVFDNSETIAKDINKKNNEINELQKEVLSKYSSAETFFKDSTKESLFLKTYFGLIKDYTAKRYENEKVPGYWPNEINLIGAQDKLYAHLNYKKASERDGMLTMFLFSHFISEIESDIDLLEALGGVAEETIGSLEPNWTVWVRPVKIGELAGQTMFNTDDERLEEMYEYRTRIIEEVGKLKITKSLVEKEWASLLDKNEPISGVSLFSGIRSKYAGKVVGTTDYSSKINNATFNKYLFLEKELQSLKADTELEEFKKNFMKKEAQETLEVADHYKAKGIYSMARIYYAEIIETEPNSAKDPYYQKEVVAQAKTKLDSIKLNLTWFEKRGEEISSLISGSKTAKELNIKYSTNDYRSAVNVWVDRVDLFTDLRYVVLFEITGAGAAMNAVFKSLGRGLKIGLTKVVATKGVQKLLSAAATKRIGYAILTAYTRTSNFLSTPFRKIRILETRWLLQMENRHLAQLLGSKPGHFVAGKTVWNGGLFGTKTWINARQNLIPKGNYKVFFDEGTAFLAMQMAKQQALGAADDVLAKRTFTQYVGQNGGQLSVGLGTTDTGQRFVVGYLVKPGKQAGTYARQGMVLVEEKIAQTAGATATSAGTTTSTAETFQALAVLSGNTNEKAALTQIARTFSNTTTQITTYTGAVGALSKAGIFVTRNGLVSSTMHALGPVAIAREVAPTVSAIINSLGTKQTVVLDKVTGKAWAESFSDPTEKEIANNLINNTRVNSVAEFELATKETARELSTAIEGEKFAVLFDFDKGKSKRWLFENYKQYLKSQPSYATYFSKNYYDQIVREMYESGIHTYVIWDDATYSGSDAVTRFIQVINSRYAGKGVKPKIVVAYSYYTNLAKAEILANENVVFIGARRMQTVSEVLTEPQKALLAKNGGIMSDGTEVLTGLSTETMPYKIPDTHSFAAGQKFVEKGIIKGSPTYKNPAETHLALETPQFESYWANGPRNLINDPIVSPKANTSTEPPQIKLDQVKTVPRNVCPNGCSVETTATKLTADPTTDIATAVNGSHAKIEMSRVERIKLVLDRAWSQLNKPLPITEIEPPVKDVVDILPGEDRLFLNDLAETTLTPENSEVFTFTGKKVRISKKVLALYPELIKKSKQFQIEIQLKGIGYVTIEDGQEVLNVVDISIPKHILVFSENHYDLFGFQIEKGDIPLSVVVKLPENVDSFASIKSVTATQSYRDKLVAAIKAYNETHGTQLTVVEDRHTHPLAPHPDFWDFDALRSFDRVKASVPDLKKRTDILETNFLVEYKPRLVEAIQKAAQRATSDDKKIFNAISGLDYDRIVRGTVTKLNSVSTSELPQTARRASAFLKYDPTQTTIEDDILFYEIEKAHEEYVELMEKIDSREKITIEQFVQLQEEGERAIPRHDLQAAAKSLSDLQERIGVKTSEVIVAIDSDVASPILTTSLEQITKDAEAWKGKDLLGSSADFSVRVVEELRNPATIRFSCHSPCVWSNGKSFAQGDTASSSDFKEVAEIRTKVLEAIPKTQEGIVAAIKVEGLSFRDASGRIVADSPATLINFVLSKEFDPSKPLMVLRTEDGKNILEVYSFVEDKSSLDGIVISEDDLPTAEDVLKAKQQEISRIEQHAVNNPTQIVIAARPDDVKIFQKGWENYFKNDLLEVSTIQQYAVGNTTWKLKDSAVEKIRKWTSYDTPIVFEDGSVSWVDGSSLPKTTRETERGFTVIGSITKEGNKTTIQIDDIIPKPTYVKKTGLLQETFSYPQISPNPDYFGTIFDGHSHPHVSSSPSTYDLGLEQTSASTKYYIGKHQIIAGGGTPENPRIKDITLWESSESGDTYSGIKIDITTLKEIGRIGNSVKPDIIIE